MNRYSNILVRKNTDGISYYCNTVFPELELNEDDIYVITTVGDRYDKLAQQFYSNPNYWWIIVEANKLLDSDGSSLAIVPGTQLRIPAYPEDYLAKWEKLNK